MTEQSYRPLSEGLPEVLAAANEARRRLFGDAPLPCVPACDSPACRGCAASRQRAKAREDAERRQFIADREARLRGCGVPASAAALIAANKLTHTHSLGATQRWLRDVLAERSGGKVRAPRVLVLAGPKDSCKSTAAGWLINRWTYDRVDAWPHFVAIEDLLDAWYAIDAPGPVTRLRKRDLLTTSLLVLDDLGQEPSHERIAVPTAEAIDIILRRRCDDGLHTMLTTNELTDVAFCTRYASRPRIAERLTEFGRWVDCPLEGFRASERREDVLRGRGKKGGAR